MSELAEHAYAGFNLIVVTAEAGWVLEATDSTSATRLTPGMIRFQRPISCPG